MSTGRSSATMRSAEGVIPVEYITGPQQATFQGFRRSNGQVGTRNYVGILTSVNCSTTVAGFIAKEIERSGILDDYPNIDGIVALKQANGCVIDYRGVIFDTLKKTTWGYATNPNMGGVIMVGLGCEGFQIPKLKEAYGVTENETFRTMTIQEVGGTKKTVEAGVEAVKAMLPIVNKAQRTTQPASELMLALQCGGSDGYSGITANPALGVAADILVRHGGTAILSETPEIYGAEHLLTRRARTPEVGEKLVDIIHWWEDYAARNNMEMNNNPSPGNKLGGLTTILEKSLGAAAKGGTTPLNAVYHYADPVTEKGFVFMDTPGYDPVSATGQVAGGANILCFTTGRGSAYGCKPTPSIKIATNSEIYHKMIDDMDINGGEVVEGSTLEQKGQEIFDMILRVASGEKEQVGTARLWRQRVRALADRSDVLVNGTAQARKQWRHRYRMVPRDDDVWQRGRRGDVLRHHGRLRESGRQLPRYGGRLFGRGQRADRRALAEGAADRGEPSGRRDQGPLPHRTRPQRYRAQPSAPRRSA